MSQRARVLLVIGVTLLPLLALSAHTLWQELAEDEENIAAERVQLASLASLAVEAFIDGHLAAARAVALHPEIAGGRAGPEIEALARRVADAHPEWEGVGVIGPDGSSIAGSGGGRPVFVGDRPYFREAVASGKPVVSPALIGRRSGKATVVIAVPIDFAAGGRGALLAPLPTDRFAASLLRKLGRPTAQLTVIDVQSQTFIDPDPARVRALVRLRGAPEADAVLAGQAGSRIAGAGEAATLVAYAPVTGYGWGVLLSEPAASAFSPARRQALERAALLALILAAVGALGWLLGGRLALYVQRADEARQALERSVETRDEFLAAASHDLRNPLTTVRSAASLLEQMLARPASVPQDRLAACVAHIDTASRRMAALIDGFLDVARLQMGRPLELELAPVDLVPLVRGIVQECGETSSRHRIVLDAPESLATEADAARLQRVVGNLLGNAIKYSPDGGEVRVYLGRETAAQALLTVHDRGLGIPEDDLARLFTRFQRGSNVIGRVAGTGIGLATARQVIEAHGGSISVESAPGRGTTFAVRLPLRAGARPEEMEAA